MLAAVGKSCSRSRRPNHQLSLSAAHYNVELVQGWNSCPELGSPPQHGIDHLRGRMRHFGRIASLACSVLSSPIPVDDRQAWGGQLDDDDRGGGGGPRFPSEESNAVTVDGRSGSGRALDDVPPRPQAEQSAFKCLGATPGKLARRCRQQMLRTACSSFYRPQQLDGQLSESPVLGRWSCPLLARRRNARDIRAA